MNHKLFTLTLFLDLYNLQNVFHVTAAKRTMITTRVKFSFVCFEDNMIEGRFKKIYRTLPHLVVNEYFFQSIKDTGLQKPAQRAANKKSGPNRPLDF